MVWCIFGMRCLFMWFCGNIWNVVWQWFNYGFLKLWDFYICSFVLGGFIVRGGTNHDVTRGLMLKNYYSCRGNFHAEWEWLRNIMMRCCDFDAFGFVSPTSVSPREKRLYKVRLSLQGRRRMHSRSNMKKCKVEYGFGNSDCYWGFTSPAVVGWGRLTW